jgi:cytoskeletal protein RodZ
MFSFQKKEIIPTTTFGEKLKKERISKDLSIERVSRKINISEEYLNAIEQGDFEKLPGEVYIKNFLKSYSGFLNLDFEKILKEYEIQKNIHQIVKKTNIETFGKKTEKTSKRWYSFITFNLLKNLALFLLIAASLAFLGFKINNIVAPPELIILKPDNNLITKNNYIEIAGQTETRANVEINGQNVVVNPDGSFSDMLNLQYGLNVIKITSEKKYSKEAVVDRKIMVER